MLPDNASKYCGQIAFLIEPTLNFRTVKNNSYQEEDYAIVTYEDDSDII